MNKKIIILLTIASFLGAFFRFYQLGSVPQSLNWDEVSWGYNAYSIVTTGRDEYVDFLPMSFRAFGDFKQPVYVYLDALPTLLWGLTGFAVRFPSALFGTITILSVFFLIRELFGDQKRGVWYALVAAGLFAISPWSIQFSRVAFEANVGIFFTITGVALFLRGINTRKLGWMVAGSIVLAISCYTYHSQKLFAPVLFIWLLFWGREWLWKQKKYLLILLLVFFVANILWMVDSRTTARGRSVLFSSQTKMFSEDTKRLNVDQNNGSVTGQILHSNLVLYTNKYIENYVQHFDPGFLFLKGDNPRHHPPFMGVEYLIALPFIIWGMTTIWSKYSRVAWLVFPWLLLAPLASSLTIDTPNASRSLVFLPLWQLFAGVGIVAMLLDISREKLRWLLGATIIGIYGISVVFYAHNYFVHTDTEFASHWQYGYREAVWQTKDTARVFFASDLEQPYIFYLFYSGLSPHEYHKHGGSYVIWQNCFQIKNAFFGACEDKLQSGDTLVTSQSSTSQTNLAKTAEIHYPNDEVALQIFRVK